MESQTYIKNVRISAKKLRFMADDIKKRKPVDALHHLNYMPKHGAKFFYKAVQSAIANAKLKLKTSDDLLRFKSLTIEQGPKFKRFRAGGRGTAKPYVRKTAHIKIVLVAEKPVEKAVIKKVKKVETPPSLKLRRTSKHGTKN